MPRWLKSKLPGMSLLPSLGTTVCMSQVVATRSKQVCVGAGALGGTREYDELEELDLDSE